MDEIKQTIIAEARKERKRQELLKNITMEQLMKYYTDCNKSKHDFNSKVSDVINDIVTKELLKS